MHLAGARRRLLIIDGPCSYYLIFAEMYSFCLRRAHVLMVNSSWTRDHIDHLLKPFGYRDDEDNDEDTTAPSIEASSHNADGGLRRRGPAGDEEPMSVHSRSTEPSKFRKARVVYPPCDTASLSQLPIEVRENLILSVAQFRQVFMP